MVVNVYSSADTPLLRIRFMGFNRLPDTVNIAPMLRTSYIIHYVTKGRGYYNGRPVFAGQGFLIYPGHIEQYYADPSDPWELLWIVSEDENMEKLFQAYDADPQTQIFSYDYIPAVCKATDTLSLMRESLQPPSVLLELFLHIWNQHKQSPTQHRNQLQTNHYVEFALDYLHMNYQSSITIQELTTLLGISQPYLFRIFKNATGKSPKTYLGDYRLMQAKQLLEKTSMSVTEIANSVGYPDVLAFSRFFTAREGLSPRSYRQKVLSNIV